MVGQQLSNFHQFPDDGYDDTNRYLGSSMGIPMGVQEPTHTHTHCGYLPTAVGVGISVGIT